MDTTKIKYDEQFIIKQYTIGKTQKEIAELLGTYNTTIRRILIRNNIGIRSQAEVRRTLNRIPFKDNSYDSEYFLGYLAADGCIHSDSNRITLSSNKDPEILEKYIKFLGAGKVHKYFNKRFNVYEFSVRVRDKATHAYLISIGLTTKKSLTLNYKDKITWEFLRGVFDGDGSIFKTKAGLLRFSIASGSHKFAVQIFNFLSDYKPKLNLHNNMYSIIVHRQEEIKKLYFNLYKNGNCFLKRKQCKFGLDNQETIVCTTANSGKQ